MATILPTTAKECMGGEKSKITLKGELPAIRHRICADFCVDRKWVSKERSTFRVQMLGGFVRDVIHSKQAHGNKK